MIAKFSRELRIEIVSQEHEKVATFVDKTYLEAFFVKSGQLDASYHMYPHLAIYFG